MGLILPFCDTIALGGFTRSSGVILWSMISALGATFFYKFRIALRWWLGYFALLIISGFLQPYLRGGVDLPAALVITFFVMNIGGVSIIVLLLLNYFKQQKDEAYRLLNLEQQKSEDLLLNVLPKEIAAVLKNEKRTIAENFDEASILFADLVGFTPLSAQLSPVEMVNLLNEIFSYFDRLVEKYDLEKIRTIGDNYMVAAGVPKPRQDHARALACMALEMRDYLAQRPPVGERQVQFRIGINSGSVIGGVIGRKKFVYDIWGDAVNIASRMESQGQPGKIQITQATFDLIQPWFECESRGLISVKGCGEVATYFLAAARPTD
jgi:guanylate cyclase